MMVDMNKKLVGIIVVALLVIVACEKAPDNVPDKPDISLNGTSPGVPDGKLNAEASQELKKFSSVKELNDFLQLNSGRQYGTYYRGFAMGGVMEESAAIGVAAPMAKTAVQQVSSDFSQTNVQVQGVDEADFVKNDNKYIYLIAQNELVIVDAYPADDARVVSRTELKGYPRELFVNGDRLIVFTDDNEEVIMISQYDYMPRPTSTQRTRAVIYDISDRRNPEKTKDFSVDGNYFQSRMIGDYVYFISKDYVRYYDYHVEPPVIREGTSKIKIVSPDVYYFDNPEDNYVFHTIASVNINDGDIEAKTFMMGHSNTLYVSEGNIYITYQKNMPWLYYQRHNEERFFEVVVPLLPSPAKEKIEALEDEGTSSYEKWAKITVILEEMYNSMEEGGKRGLMEDIEKAIQDYELKLEIERSKTVIQKINIKDGDIDYDCRGEVMGYMLNQFSLDEYDNHLRVATTTQIYARGRSEMYNNVYVLDEEMEVVGKVEDIAPEERIYSTRFIGDRLYMVTFQRVDPLFVIDLSDHKHPRILGELKIPGFSDYLHPYDENHIIGVGKETASNEWGGVSIKGVKVSLFDVSDVDRPKQIDSYEIGESGTDSEALRDHKAFLFDKKKNILVLPIREVKSSREYDPRLGYYYQRIWQGAYVLSVSPEDGIEVKGKVSHFDGDESSRWYWSSPSAVRRSLYMDDVLYTVSQRKVLMNDLEDLGKINEVMLPYTEEKYYQYMWE